MDANIVEQDVQATKLADRSLHHNLALAGDRHIRLNEHRVIAFGPDAPFNHFTGVSIDVSHNNQRATIGKFFRCDAAYTQRSARDNHHFAFEFCHNSLSCHMGI